MDIKRRGADRNHGHKTILSGIPLRHNINYWEKRQIQWVPSSNTVAIETGPAKDPTSKSHHIYRIELTLEDIATLITTIGQVASEENASSLRDSLAKHSSSLIRLLACSAGILPVDIPNAQ